MYTQTVAARQVSKGLDDLKDIAAWCNGKLVGVHEEQDTQWGAGIVVGDITATKGAWIIKDATNHFSVMQNDLFTKRFTKE
jgi:hypothetical protein